MCMGLGPILLSVRMQCCYFHTVDPHQPARKLINSSATVDVSNVLD